MKRSARGLAAVLVGAIVAVTIFAAPIRAEDPVVPDKSEVLKNGGLEPTQFIGPEFVLLAYTQLEENYYKSASLHKPKLFNAALLGIAKFLKHKGIEFVPNKIEDNIGDATAIDKFTSEYYRAAEFAKNLEWVEATDLAFYATKYMLHSLESSHVYFMSPEQMEERRKMLTGEALFSGIGVVIVKLGADKKTDEFEEEKEDKDAFIYLAKIYPGAPADKAGFKKFDRIVEVNGAPINGTMKELVGKIKGPKGTAVKVTVERVGERKVIEVTRDDIKPPVPEVNFYVKDGKRMMHVVLHSFEPSSLGHLKKILIDNKYDGLVLDLRSNPGGYVGVLGAIASYFLKPETLLFTSISRGEPPRSYRTKKLSFYTRVPMIVMIDGYSASAAEIMAAAMKDHKRGLVVGDKSAGAVEVGTTLNLTHGAGIVVAISDVLSPSGARIENAGVLPDVLLKLEDDHVKAGKDMQLDIAVGVLLDEIKK